MGTLGHNTLLLIFLFLVSLIEMGCATRSTLVLCRSIDHTAERKACFRIEQISGWLLENYATTSQDALLVPDADVITVAFRKQDIVDWIADDSKVRRKLLNLCVSLNEVPQSKEKLLVFFQTTYEDAYYTTKRQQLVATLIGVATLEFCVDWERSE